MKIVLIICFAVNLSRMAAPPWESTLSISLAAQHWTLPMAICALFPFILLILVQEVS